MTSSISAASRTERVIGPLVKSPPQISPATGDSVTLPREGLRPTTPQHEAGMRTDPPPSLPSASGPSPVATCAAAPPLEPPVVCSRFHGFRAGGQRPPSVVGLPPYSGVAVLPSKTPPARRSRTTISASAGGTKLA